MFFVVLVQALLDDSQAKRIGIELVRLIQVVGMPRNVVYPRNSMSASPAPARATSGAAIWASLCPLGSRLESGS